MTADRDACAAELDRLDGLVAGGTPWYVEPRSFAYAAIIRDANGRMVHRVASIKRAEEIAAAVNALPGFIAWGRSVLERHGVGIGYGPAGQPPPAYCDVCEQYDPCPEVRSLARALGVGE